MILIGFLTSPVASEKDDPKPDQIYNVPHGTTLRPQVDNKGRPAGVILDREYKCYEAQEYLVIAKIITDYRWFWKYSSDLELKLKLQSEQQNAMISQRSLLEDSLLKAEKALDKSSRLFELSQTAQIKNNHRRDTELMAWRVATGLLVGSVVVTSVIGLRNK